MNGNIVVPMIVIKKGKVRDMSRQIVKCNWCNWVDYEDELKPDEKGILQCTCPSCDHDNYLMDVDFGCTFDNNQIEKLWMLLEDIPFVALGDGSLVLDDDWFGFKKGTERAEIWSWFDDNYSGGVVELLYGESV